MHVSTYYFFISVKDQHAKKINRVLQVISVISLQTHILLFINECLSISMIETLTFYWLTQQAQAMSIMLHASFYQTI